MSTANQTIKLPGRLRRASHITEIDQPVGTVGVIYLWSGKYDYRSPSLWDADRPKYAEQMKQLQQWMDEARSAGIFRIAT